MKDVIGLLLAITLLVITCNDGRSQNFLKVGAGYVAGMLIHETGHWIANERTGTKYKIKDGHFVSHTSNDAHAREISCAGFGAEFVASEIAFIGKGNDYKTGIILHSIINPLGYVIRERFFKNGGDIETFGHWGGNKKILRSILISHAAVNLYRLYLRPKSIVPYTTENAVGIAYQF